jgi:formate-dependent nitrite reductase cytochrome c552 subunit
VQEVRRVMETDYTNEVSVALIATAERPEYEEWVTLAEFTKIPIKEIH